VIHILDRQAKAVRKIPHPGTVKALAFTPDDRILAAVGSQALCLYDAQLGTRVADLPLEETGRSLVFFGDGRLLAMSTESRPAVVLSVPELALQSQLERSESVNCFDLSPDGAFLVGGHSDGTIHIWETASGRVKAQLEGHEASVYDVAFSPDGKALLSASGDGTVRAWSVEHAREYGVLFRAKSQTTNLPDYSICRLSLAQDGRHFIVGDRNTSYRLDVHIWNLAAAMADAKLNN
jgi:WD40 repeat protein